MPNCAVNGTDLYYESHGSGPALIFIHGAGGNHASWWQQIPAFEHGHRVVVYDQRGFGHTADPEGKGRAAFGDDLAGLLDALAIERAVLVAQSLGGGAALAMAASQPGRVRGLVVADTLVGFDLPDDIARPMAAARARTEGLPQLERVLGPATRARRPDLARLYAQIAGFNRYSVATVPARGRRR